MDTSPQLYFHLCVREMEVIWVTDQGYKEDGQYSTKI
jgi:hypothetical protein